MDTETKKFWIYGCTNCFVWFMVITFCIAFWATIISLIYLVITEGIC